MPATTPINRRRKGTLATPENIFPACTALYATMSDNFKVEDVIARIGGGSNTTVGPLVKAWRANKGLLVSLKAMDAVCAVELVQHVDRILDEKVKNADAALADFNQGAGVVIAELAQEKELQEATLAQQAQQLANEHAKSLKLEHEIVALRAQLSTANSQNQQAIKHTQHLTDQLDQAKHQYATELSDKDRSHTQALTLALETQRRTLSQEYDTQNQKNTANYNQQLAQAAAQTTQLNQRIESLVMALNTAKNAASQIQHSLTLQSQQAHKQERALQHTIEKLEAELALKQTELQASTPAANQMLVHFKEQSDALLEQLAHQLNPKTKAHKKTTAPNVEPQPVINSSAPHNRHCWSRAQIIQGLKTGSIIQLSATGLVVKFVMSDGANSGYLANSKGDILRFKEAQRAIKCAEQLNQYRQQKRS